MKPWKLVFVFAWCAVLRCVVSIAVLPYFDGYYLDVAAQVFQYLLLVAICCSVGNLDRACLQTMFGGFSTAHLMSGIGLAFILAALTIWPDARVAHHLGNANTALALHPANFHAEFSTAAPRFPVHLVIYLLVNVLMAAVVEEFYFRGLLFPALAQRRSLIWSSVLCAMLFSFAHLGEFVNFKAYLFTCVLLYAYVKGGSLYTCITGHVGYNLLTFLDQYWTDVHEIAWPGAWIAGVCAFVWLVCWHGDHLRSWRAE